MLYSYDKIKKLDYTTSEVPLKRYLHKYLNQRKEIKKLKFHEKHFLFEKMSILKQGDEYAYDLSSIEEAYDYYFNRLILTYFGNLSFYKETKDHLGNIISKEKMQADKLVFDNNHHEWIRKVETKKGKFLGIVYTELKKRLKEQQEKYDRKLLKEAEYNYRTKEIYAISFCIYYKVMHFFDGLQNKFVHINISGVDIVINIYSFIHILFRHYYPALDDSSRKRDINAPLPFLNINELPNSLKDFIISYTEHIPDTIDYSTEYLLFSFNNVKYIIWLKYKQLEELNNHSGLEFRTLYKCSAQRDFNKFDGLTEYSVNTKLSYYF